MIQLTDGFQYLTNGLQTYFAAAPPPVIQSSDSATGTDAISITGNTVVSDSGIGSDTSSITSTFTVSDDASGTDSSYILHGISIQDSGSESEALSVSVAAQVTDSGSGSESHGISSTLSVSDSAAGTDSASVSVSSVIVATTDSAAGSDTGSVTASVSISDSGSATDSGSVSANIPVTDSGTGTDGVSTNQSGTLLVSDSGTASDSEGIAATVSVTDSATGIDQSGILGMVPASDSAVSSDSVNVSAAITVADNGTANDSGVTVSGTVSVTDQGTGTDSVSIFVTFSVAESGAGADSVSVYAPTLIPIISSPSREKTLGPTAIAGNISQTACSRDRSGIAAVSVHAGASSITTSTYSTDQVKTFECKTANRESIRTTMSREKAGSLSAAVGTTATTGARTTEKHGTITAFAGSSSGTRVSIERTVINIPRTIVSVTGSIPKGISFTEFDGISVRSGVNSRLSRNREISEAKQSSHTVGYRSVIQKLNDHENAKGVYVYLSESVHLFIQTHYAGSLAGRIEAHIVELPIPEPGNTVIGVGSIVRTINLESEIRRSVTIKSRMAPSQDPGPRGSMTKLYSETRQSYEVYSSDVGTQIILDCEEDITDFAYFDLLLKPPRNSPVRVLSGTLYGATSISHVLTSIDLSAGPGDYLIHGRLRKVDGTVFHTDLERMKVIPLWTPRE